MSISASVSPNKPNLAFPSLGEIVIFAKGRQSCQGNKCHWYPYPGNYLQILSLVQTESLWSPDEKLFWEQMPGVLTKRRKQGSSFYAFTTKQWAVYKLFCINFFCPKGTHLTPMHLLVSCAAICRFVWLQKRPKVSNPDGSGTSGEIMCTGLHMFPYRETR